MAGVIIEATPRLLAQPIGLYEPAQYSRLLQPLAILRVEMGQDMVAHVETQHVHQCERPHGPPKPVWPQGSIDLGHGGCPFLEADRRLIEVGHQHSVH